MKDLNADFFEMLDTCCEPSHVETAWQTWMTKLGYERSGIFVFSWKNGKVELPRYGCNWGSHVMDDYLEEEYYRFDPAGHPLRKSSSFAATHVNTFSPVGKPASFIEFVDFVHSLCLPLEVSVPIVVANDLRLGFSGWADGTEREAAMLAKETQDAIRFAANAGAARFMQLTDGIIYPKDSALSPREAECLLWLAKGDRNAEIARRLGVNNKTVDFHLAGARQKLNAKTSTEAVVIAVINRYIKL